MFGFLLGVVVIVHLLNLCHGLRPPLQHIVEPSHQGLSWTLQSCLFHNSIIYIIYYLSFVYDLLPKSAWRAFVEQLFMNKIMKLGTKTSHPFFQVEYEKPCHAIAHANKPYYGGYDVPVMSEQRPARTASRTRRSFLKRSFRFAVVSSHTTGFMNRWKKSISD